MTTPLSLYNGKFIPEDKYMFSVSDLSSILFQEKIRAIRNQFPFWEEHVKLIHLKFKLLNAPLPIYLKNEGCELKRQIERSLIKNKLYKSAILTITFLQHENTISYLISTTASDETRFTLNNNGHILTVFNKIQKAISPLSSLSLGSDVFWKIAETQDLHTPGNHLLITNRHGDILETPGKNIYLISANKVLTPSPSIGAYVDISKNKIQLVIKKLGLKLEEVEKLNETEFQHAEEVFLANAINGIEWVKGFNRKRFFCKTVREINEAFNHELIQ